MRYHDTGKAKENGVVYTPTEMAAYVADEIIAYHTAPLGREISILDPAAGAGELLIAMIRAMQDPGRHIRAVGYETDKEVGRQTQKKLEELFPQVEIEIRTADFLTAVESGVAGSYDCVIANPPYIRTQIMGSARAQEIAKKLSLAGRVDIYYAFLLYTKEILKPDGVAGYITSNKFMTIQAGKAVRNYMLKNFAIHHITDLGDTKLFTASVLPCILVFSLGQTVRNSSVAFTSVYQTDAGHGSRIATVFDAIGKSGVYQLSDGKCYRFQQGNLQSVEPGALWTISSADDQDWLGKAEEATWLTFSQIGNIRVGIKTTADNVFIGDSWSGEDGELELLRPLITHRNAGQIVANSHSQWQVLYTHTTENGKKQAYDLEQYPKSKAYLMRHFDQLNGRGYIKSAKRNWYEIWVPQNPDAWKHRKIVFRDISDHPQFWLDETGAVVNGDCYWIDIKPDVPEDVIYLALAVANSPFIEKYYDIKFNTRLYSGKRRYQTQYVAQFPIPYYDSELARDAVSLVKKIIAEGNSEIASGYKKKLDQIVSELFR